MGERTTEPCPSVDDLNTLSPGRFPGLVGFRVVVAEPGRVCAELDVAPHLHAPNGYLHAGVVVTLADTACGYGVRTCMPAGAKGFTTIDLTSNFLGTALDGTICVEAVAVHRGGRTQVWDAMVRSGRVDGGGTTGEHGRPLALFRCTQMILW
jgi:1,4-dihydroxy-2-naphthoyl-CoA hydrolase